MRDLLLSVVKEIMASISSMPPMRCGLDQLGEAKIEKNQIVGVVILVESGISQTSMLNNFNAYHMTLGRA